MASPPVGADSALGTSQGLAFSIHELLQVLLSKGLTVTGTGKVGVDLDWCSPSSSWDEKAVMALDAGRGVLGLHALRSPLGLEQANTQGTLTKELSSLLPARISIETNASSYRPVKKARSSTH